MPGETLTPELQIAAKSHTLITAVEAFREGYIRGDIIDVIDHSKQPFRGAARNLRLVTDLMPNITPLIELAGGNIGFGNTRFIRKILGLQLEIGQNEIGEIGLKYSTPYHREYPTPIIQDQTDLAILRTAEDPGAVRAFGSLSGLELLDKVEDFARRNAKGQTHRIPVPSSSNGGLPWV